MLDSGEARRVVPRWRSSWRTAETPESQSNRPGKRQNFAPAVTAAKHDFDVLPTVPHAAELMFVAHQANNFELSRTAASIVVAAENSISSVSLLTSAKRILDNDDGYKGFAGSRDDFIRESRRLLRLDYDNPILLTDVALALTGSARAPAAERFMLAALHSLLTIASSFGVQFAITFIAVIASVRTSSS